MHNFSRAMSLLGSSVAVLLAHAGTAQAASGTMEVDLVFPQNDTYAPAHIVPVAFAFQNSDLAGYLQPSISFSIKPYGGSSEGNSSKAIANGNFKMTWTNFTESNPYVQYGEALEGLNTEGTWVLDWELSVSNCSGSADDLKFTLDSEMHRVIFTTKNGAKAPDVSAATSADSCSKSQGRAFKITKTLDSGDKFDNGRPCAVLAETAPALNPCGAKINASAAADVVASFTAKACAIETAPWCPKVDGANQNVVLSSAVVGGVAFLAVAVGGMGFLAI
ncbi:hypothetical protein V492_05754 [Pseudogymnoascus sp. VKM F-4246]|nr:hypothetical protein V492_05754 [Pseudogymnoascus sp. VKM F-4246]